MLKATTSRSLVIKINIAFLALLLVSYLVLLLRPSALFGNSNNAATASLVRCTLHDCHLRKVRWVPYFCRSNNRCWLAIICTLCTYVCFKPSIRVGKWLVILHNFCVVLYESSFMCIVTLNFYAACFMVSSFSFNLIMNSWRLTRVSWFYILCLVL
jgi:hypothetical protein